MARTAVISETISRFLFIGSPMGHLNAYAQEPRPLAAFTYLPPARSVPLVFASAFFIGTVLKLTGASAVAKLEASSGSNPLWQLVALLDVGSLTSLVVSVAMLLFAWVGVATITYERNKRSVVGLSPWASANVMTNAILAVVLLIGTMGAIAEAQQILTAFLVLMTIWVLSDVIASIQRARHATERDQ
ncbi:hypothetical protein V8J82_22270 [Gymnodinialimonas sp. 2305UL16-5]|uniref:hypothetical protein n=1 Tax=Gymnodinialimonas mytili TaxID=3126503 RepID=UPI0030998D0D